MLQVMALISPALICTFTHTTFQQTFVCVIYLAMIECGSKKEGSAEDMGVWTDCEAPAVAAVTTAESRGNFPRRHHRPSEAGTASFVRHHLRPLAAIVPTAVNHVAYESKPQSIALLMNWSSSPSLSPLSSGVPRHIWQLQLVR